MQRSIKGHLWISPWIMERWSSTCIHLNKEMWLCTTGWNALCVTFVENILIVTHIREVEVALFPSHGKIFSYNIDTALCAQLRPTLQPHGLYVARQTPLPMGLSRQEYWSRLPWPPPGTSWPRDWTHVSFVSCIGKWILLRHLGKHIDNWYFLFIKESPTFFFTYFIVSTFILSFWFF